MRNINAIAAVASLFLPSLGEAITLTKRDVPAVVKLDIQRRDIDVKQYVKRDQEREARRISRRDDSTHEVTLDNEQTLYLANLTLGTPGQDFQLHIDTGSSDLWVNAANSRYCSSKRRCPTGTYNANASSTYQYINSAFDISYLDGSGASGDYVSDDVDIGGAALNDLQFGVGYTSTNPNGILGIGYMENEVAVGTAGMSTYPNLPQKMKDQGLIEVNAYSLWLNDLSASTGSILFGGVDTEKYQGDLVTLPIISESGVYAEFLIALTDMAMGGSTLFKDQTLPVLLDSGSSLTYLPNNVVSAIYNQYDAVYDNQQGLAFVDCSLANSDETLDFTFSGATIPVPMRELVLDADSGGSSSACVFGIAPAGSQSSSVVLGDTFLRSAYVVYDLSRNEISLAATNFNASKSNIETITSGAGGVPNAVHMNSAGATVSVTPGSGKNGSIQDTSIVPGAAAMPTPPPVFRPQVVVAAVGAGILAAL